MQWTPGLVLSCGWRDLPCRFCCNPAFQIPPVASKNCRIWPHMLPNRVGVPKITASAAAKVLQGADRDAGKFFPGFLWRPFFPVLLLAGSRGHGAVSLPCPALRVLPLPRLLPSGAHDQTKNNTGSGVSWQVFLSTCEDCRRLIRIRGNRECRLFSHPPCPRLVPARKRMDPGSNLALDFSDGAEDCICKLL
jgi:hypothetical protein